MPESFGARLRQQRERQQIALTTIADQTKIKASLLDALERDDVSYWPTGIFRRSFIRTYAQAIGLEPDTVVREFLERYPDPVDTVPPVEALAARADAERISRGTLAHLRNLMGSAFGALAQPRRDAASKPSAVVQDHSGAAAPVTSREPDGSPQDSTDGAQTPERTGRHDLDLLAAADLCTELGRLQSLNEAAPLLHHAASILDAVGLIIWTWEPGAVALKLALGHGYPDTVLAHLSVVSREAENATAAAFRSAGLCTVSGSERAHGALVVPLIGSAGCVGVLAIELHHGCEQVPCVRAVATMFAAQLAALIASAHRAAAFNRKLA